MACTLLVKPTSSASAQLSVHDGTRTEEQLRLGYNSTRSHAMLHSIDHHDNQHANTTHKHDTTDHASYRGANQSHAVNKLNVLQNITDEWQARASQHHTASKLNVLHNLTAKWQPQVAHHVPVVSTCGVNPEQPVSVFTSCSKWEEWEVLGEAVPRLPVERPVLGGAGCRFRVCQVNSTECVEQGELISMPSPSVPVVYLAGRVLMRLLPPLPSTAAAADWVIALAIHLNFAPNRFHAVEASSSGEYLLMDVHPLDAYNKHEVSIMGPKVADVIQLLADFAGTVGGLNVSGHVVDNTLGVWRLPATAGDKSLRLAPSFSPGAGIAQPHAPSIVGFVVFGLLVACICWLGGASSHSTWKSRSRSRRYGVGHRHQAEETHWAEDSERRDSDADSVASSRRPFVI